MVGTNASGAPGACARSAAMSLTMCISAQVEKFAAALHAAYSLHQEFEVRVALHEVEILRIHDQYGRCVVVIEESRIAFGEQGQVLFAYAAFEQRGAPPDAIN